MAAALTIASPVFAQDASWSGPFIGLGVSINSGASDVTTASTRDGISTLDKRWVDAGWQETFDSTAATSGRVSQERFRGIIEAGYDFQIGEHFVFGLNANYDFGGSSRRSLYGKGQWEDGEVYGILNDAGTAIDKTSRCADIEGAGCTYVQDRSAYEAGDADVTASVRTGDTWGIGARLGYLATPSTLVYVAGGYTQQKTSLGVIGTVTPTFNDYAGIDTTLVTAADRNISARGTDWNDGYYVGGGVEAKLSRHISAKLDYRYSDYGAYGIDANGTMFTFADGGTTSKAASVMSSDQHAHSLRAVVSYRF